MKLLLALLAAVCPAQVRPLQPADLPPSLRQPGWLEQINQTTTQRLRDGEWDHLIFYALQSTRFTSLPPIEPALSARQFHESSQIPPAVTRRLEAFLSTTPATERHTAMRRLATSLDQLHTEYRRAMAFLYEKEWQSRAKQGPARRDFIASLYQTRAHSTDTELRATYGIHIGLSVLASLQPKPKLRRTLLIGPGLDWAPRTNLQEDAPPQSYQPYTLADSLLRLQLAPPEWQIDCADINPRVIDAIQSFPSSPRRLTLRYAPGDADWNSYFDSLGQTIGARDGSQLTVHAPAARNIRAFRMNLLTETPASSYDLIVLTNVLLYFNDRELTLALANLARALAPNGLLLHNDLRPAVESAGRQFQLPPIHARTVRIDPTRELYDAVVLHQRAPAP